MLEIANAFSGSTHSKTLVFVSTDGCSIGALGARRFVRDYTSADLLDGAIVLSQPASPDPEPPLVIPWSIGPQSTASQLAETAKRDDLRGDGNAGGRRGASRRPLPAGAPGCNRRAGAVDRGRPGRGSRLVLGRAGTGGRGRRPRQPQSRNPRSVRARLALPDADPRRVSGRPRARPQCLHRPRRQSASGLDPWTAGARAALAGGGDRRGWALGLGPQPRRGGAGADLGRHPRSPIPGGAAGDGRADRGRAAAQSRVPLRPRDGVARTGGVALPAAGRGRSRRRCLVPAATPSTALEASQPPPARRRCSSPPSRGWGSGSTIPISGCWWASGCRPGCPPPLAPSPDAWRRSPGSWSG